MSGSMKVLVVGGAGYIGSHMVARLALDHEVVVLDDLSTGYRAAVAGVELIEGNLGDAQLLDQLFNEHAFDAVMHFAAFIEVAESVVNPSKYYLNNVSRTLVLLDAMSRHEVKYFVFSSTAAIFGVPEASSIDEQHTMNPINPYGQTKLMVERILADYDRAYGLKSVCLRYFNAAGAMPDASLGERHDPETHLIPLVLQAASGRRSAIAVFGDDYPTEDGSCVRDYIHVLDLCEAHLLALQHVMDTGSSNAFNLGNGEGYSVKQVIDAVKRVSQREFDVMIEARREGDPAVLVADSQQAKEVLGWSPKYAELDTIIAHAWAWEQKHPW